MIMRIFPVLLMAITGCVIRHTQKINQHYSYTHYYLAACQLLGVVCMLCMLRVSFFFLVSFSSMSTHTYLLEDLRGQKITLNQFGKYYWKDLTFFIAVPSGYCRTFKKHVIQSELSLSKNIWIFLKKIFIEEYDFRGTLFVIDVFWKLQFLNHFIS